MSHMSPEELAPRDEPSPTALGADALQPRGPGQKWRNLSVAAGAGLLSPSTSGAQIISVRPLLGLQPLELNFGLVCVVHPENNVPNDAVTPVSL